MILCSVGGVQSQSFTVDQQMKRYRVPRIAFINKMDRTGADFHKAVDSIRTRLGGNPVILQIPLGTEDNLRGVVDLVRMRAIEFDVDSLGADLRVIDIPAELRDEADHWHDEMVEFLASHSDGLGEKYVHEEPITAEDLVAAIREVTLRNELSPVLCGSALKNCGIQPLLDLICDALPSPVDLPPIVGVKPGTEGEEKRAPSQKEPLSALSFKLAADRFGELVYTRVYSGTLVSGKRVYNATRDRTERVNKIFRMHADERTQIEEATVGDIVGLIGLKFAGTGDTLCDKDHPIVLERMSFPNTVISQAIEPKANADRQKMNEVLAQLVKEDPTFRYGTDEDTGQTIIHGMGELHLEVLEHKMQREMGLNVTVGAPRVAYRETFAGTVEAEGKYIHQTGGRGQYGHVKIRVEPWDSPAGPLVVDEVKGGEIPAEFISSCEQGIIDCASGGVLAGYPLINIKVTLLGGSFHTEDSSDPAFMAAASRALQNAAKAGTVVLLEPIMKLEVEVPESFMGDVLNDLNARRAEIVDIGIAADLREVDAKVPLSQMFGYTTKVRSLTQGRAQPVMEPLTYAPVPEDETAKITGAF
jgi:elongation factor G